MTRDQRVHHYQNLLMLAAMPFAWLLVDQAVTNIELPEQQHCDVYHENAKVDLKCEASPT